MKGGKGKVKRLYLQKKRKGLKQTEDMTLIQLMRTQEKLNLGVIVKKRSNSVISSIITQRDVEIMQIIAVLNMKMQLPANLDASVEIFNLQVDASSSTLRPIF